MNLYQRVVLAVGAIALVGVVFFTPKIQRDMDGLVVPAGTYHGYADQLDYSTIKLRSIGVTVATGLLWLAFKGITPDRRTFRKVIISTGVVMFGTALLLVLGFHQEISDSLIAIRATAPDGSSQAALSSAGVTYLFPVVVVLGVGYLAAVAVWVRARRKSGQTSTPAEQNHVATTVAANE